MQLHAPLSGPGKQCTTPPTHLQGACHLHGVVLLLALHGQLLLQGRGALQLGFTQLALRLDLSTPPSTQHHKTMFASTVMRRGMCRHS